MKKLIKFSAVALAVSLATAGHANLVRAHDLANNSMGKINVQLNVLPSMAGYLSGNVNMQVTPSSAIGVYGGIWAWEDTNVDTTIDGNKYSHSIAAVNLFNIGVQYSYAVNGQYMSTGWLVKPFIGYIQSSYENISVTGLSFGAMIDHQWVFDSGLMVQVGVGPRYFHAESDPETYSKFGFTGEVNVGYAF